MSLRTRFFAWTLLVHLVFAVATLLALREHRVWIVGLEAFFFLSFVVSIVFVRRLAAPVDRLRESTELLRSGDFATRIRPTGRSELDPMIDVYNRMADHLHQERTRAREQENLLQLVEQESPVAMIVLDMDRRIDRMNPAAESLLGVTEDGCRGQVLAEVPSALAPRLVDIPDGEAFILPFSGSRRVRVRKLRFIDRGFPRDFLLLDELTEELRQSERAAYGKLIRMMSHEVNNTTGAVGSLLESCRAFSSQLTPQDAADFERALDVALGRIDNMNTFMRSFAEVVRLGPPRLETVSLLAVLKDLQRLLAEELRQREIEWRWGGPEGGSESEDAFRIQADPVQLERALLNILRNAVQAIDEKGEVEVRLSRDQRTVVLEVFDDGDGIDEEKARQIFTPFFSTRPSGQGIGLTLVQEILVGHGCDYSLESIDGRTRFRIEFSPPWYPQVNTASPHEADGNPAAEKGTVTARREGTCLPARRPFRSALAAAAVLALTPHPAEPGSIDPRLESRLQALAPGAKESAILFLLDEAPVAQLSESLTEQGATRRERHREIVLALQATAASSQGPVLQRLEQLQAEGRVSGYTPYWIANLIVVHGDRSALIELSARPDVARAEPNFRAAPVRPIPSPETGLAEVDRERLPGGAGATSGIRCIKADRVWYELGVTGQGALVANLDTGVDGSHPALANRWRGLHAGWEEGWRDVLGTGTTFPTDNAGHGTHVMGTMTGLGLETGDSIGVAPAAEWIAANAVDQSAGPDFDNDIVECYQWFADPDGDPETVNDVPDVVQNSWGITAFPPFDYTICDTRFWAVMDNLEAAGTVLTYSAGNSGPGATTLLSPADRSTTALNAFAVGAIDGRGSFPFPLWPQSSRGPSGCPEHATKPELVAPGVGVRSSIPGGGYYAGWSGTSLAGPHVAGLVALMRSADPDVEVERIKQILLDTAVDLGDPGEDNSFGWGVPDAYSAVVSVLSSASVAGGTELFRSLTAMPNPFNDDTAVEFSLREPATVRITIFDPTGRVVRTVLDRMMLPGSHEVRWNGRDSRDQRVPAGIYFSRVQAGPISVQRKLLRVR